MKRKGQITFLIVPEDSARSIRRRFSYNTLYVLASIAGICLIAFAFMAMNYGRVYYKALKAEVLERKNVKLEEQYQKIALMERELTQLKKTDQKIRKVLGSDLAPGPPKLSTSGNGVLSEHTESPLGGMSQTANAVERADTTARLLEGFPTTWPVRGWSSRPFSSDHTGIDIAAPTGTPIVATTSGTVKRAGWDDRYGNIIEIDNDQGFTTVYGHNSRLLVEEGERVKKGDVIAFVGSTGLSSAPHVHYEVWLKGKPVDPLRYLVH
jgi:murein DD-endopeptidase MepM/ murein hydrolase activator NlpD